MIYSGEKSLFFITQLLLSDRWDDGRVNASTERCKKRIEYTYLPIHVGLQDRPLQTDVGAGRKAIFNENTGRVVSGRRDRTDQRFRNDTAKNLIKSSHLVRLEAHTLVEAYSA